MDDEMENDVKKYDEKKNIIKNKSFLFAIRIVKLHQYLTEKYTKIYSLSDQVLRSGTSIGALMSESVHAQSKADFLNKCNVALKEANETLFWISLLYETKYINEEEYNSLNKDCEEILKLLISIVKTMKERLNK